MSDDNVTPNNSNAETPVTPQGQSMGDNGNLLTQDEVNKLLGQRAKRAQEATLNSILGELGVDSLDSIKTLLQDAKAKREAEMSEVEKIQQAQDKAKREAEEYRQKYEALQAQRIADKRNDVIKAALQKAGGQDLDNLLILINVNNSTAMDSIFDGETVSNDKELAKLVSQAQTDFARFFVTANAGSPSNAGGTPPSSQQRVDAALKLVKRQHGI